MLERDTSAAPSKDAAAAPTGPGRPVRASHAEREETVRLVHQALGEGRLDLEEAETRAAAAYAAVYRGELPSLLDDLPLPVAPAALVDASGPPSWQTLWTALVWRARASLWDGPAAARRIPPGAGQRRLTALLLVLAAVWLLTWAVIGAVM
jgi:hypothetical protein